MFAQKKVSGSGGIMLAPSPCQLYCRPLITKLSGLLRLSFLQPLSGPWCHFKGQNWLNSSCQIQCKKEPSINSHLTTKYVPPDSLQGGAGTALYLDSTPSPVVLGVLALCALCALCSNKSYVQWIANFLSCNSFLDREAGSWKQS